MEYIGEHLLPGQLGRFFVSLALISALISAISYFLFQRNAESAYHRLGRVSFIIHAFSIFTVVGILFFMLSQHYFEYDYIWKHSSLSLEPKYIFSAFWEGQEGSFLLWMFWHAVLGLIMMFNVKKWEASSMMIFALVQMFLCSMILGIYIGDVKIGSSPFILLRQTVDNIGLPWTQVPDYLEKFPTFMDGTGLNPLLQNYWMTIHPPTLFLGFASTLPPFALAIAALLNRDYTDWIKPALPWAYFSVMIFGTGILMGGAWAYEALSFGGFWAWDPVENSSLVPWLVMVGAAHLLLLIRNRKTGYSAAFFMVIFSFLLVLYSTFLTRSGVLGDASVHAFVDLGLNGQLLVYLFFFTILSLILYFARIKEMPRSKSDDDFGSREFWMFIGSLVLLISAFQIIFSTSIPVFNKIIGPDGFIPLIKDEMAPPLDEIKHYNSFQIPFAIVITLLMGLAQFLNYRKTSANLFWKRSAIAVLLSLIFTYVFTSVYNLWRDPLLITLLFTALFAVISNLIYWFIQGKAKITFAGSSIAHIGFGFIMVGALISNGRQEIISNTEVFLSEDMPSNENALLELNDSIPLGKYTAVWTGMREVKDKQYYDVEYYLPTESGLNKVFTLHPFLQMSTDMGPTPNPSTRHYWNKDIYTHVTYSSYLAPTTPDGYGKEMEVELGPGDTAIYSNHFLIRDSLKVSASYNEETGHLEKLRLRLKLILVNVLGEETVLYPTYIMEGNTVSHEDVILDMQKFKIRFADVNTEENKFIIKAWTKQEDETPFIVMKAIVFPLINLLWAGCILMALGSGIAVWQRIKDPKRASGRADTDHKT